MALLPGFLLFATILLFRTTLASGIGCQNFVVNDSDAEALREALPYLGLENNQILIFIDNLCCWPVISCDNSTGERSTSRVNGLDLGDYSVVGSLPPSIGKLTALKKLNLTSGTLTGSIPDSWRNLKSLESLDLSYNGLNGTLDVVGNWTKLQILSLESNHFSGEMDKIPIDKLTALTELIMDSNDFTGPFPGWIGKLSELTYLVLGENPKLSPSILPSEYSSWPNNLDTVMLSSMNLNGKIPEFFLINSTLSFVDLRHNSLSGNIPQISEESFITDLYVDNNNLLGKLPQIFSSFLVTFSVANNNLTGTIPLVSVFSNMAYVNLSGNQFHGSLPAKSFWDKIQTIDLSRNRFTGNISALMNLPKLTYLNLSGNKFYGPLPAEVLWQKIQTIDLSRNRFTGNISALMNLPKITYLNISGNKFYGLLPDNSSWDAILTIDLSRNLFVGDIPVSFGEEATLLRELDLSENNLTGAIPSHLGNFSFLQFLDLSNNQFNSGIPDTFGAEDFVYDDSLEIYKPSSFSGLLYLNLSRCNLSGTISEKIGNLRKLSILDLSQNQLSGNITDLHETRLATLDLSENNLSGELPEFLAKLPLEILNLSMNKLTGYVPPSFSTRNLTNCTRILGIVRRSFFPGNNLFASCKAGFVENYPFPPPPPSPPSPLSSLPSSGQSFPVYAIPITVVGSTLLIFLAALAAYFCIFKKKMDFITKKINEHTVKFLPIQVISEATDNFSESNALGAGGFGIVYKGIAKNGELWAVKRAKNASVESLEQFKNEVEIISRMNHKNIVKLFGFCYTDTEQILVYEFIENGTLKSALKRGRGTSQPVLTFEQRVEIALGAAEGLRYLHTQAKPSIIHRDVKSENVLLDTNMQAKVCDFGLLKDNEDKEELAKRTAVAGTYGYMDPEYYTTYRVTAKSDVYSFGVVILELITGQEALLEEITGDGVHERISLASWALKMMRSTLGLSAIVDPSLDSNYSLDDMNVLASVAASCLQKVSMYRPEMADVASHLRLLKTKMENKHSQVMENNGLTLLPSEEVLEEEGPIYPIVKTSTSSKTTSVDSRSLGNSSLFRPVPKESVLLPR